MIITGALTQDFMSAPPESGAKQTRKAAREASKRRDDRKFPPMKNELEDINENKPTKHKSVVNRILDTLR